MKYKGKTSEYYDGLDKRTREYKNYKEWKTKFEAKQKEKEVGLGDVVEKITEATGIKKVVKSVFGDDCGCDERKEKLNKIKLPQKVVNCPTEDEWNYLVDFFADERPHKVRQLFPIYNRIFGSNQRNTRCSSCVNKVRTALAKLINGYK